jgi:hypothetical protein
MDLAAAKSGVTDLTKAAKALGDALAAMPQKSEADIETLLKAVRGEMDRVVAAVGGAKTSLAEFMSDVGKSLVMVQKQLDRESENYNRVAGATSELKGIAQPTSFRVPRVNASIKFAMSTESSQRVGLLFFSSTEAAKNAHQQSVDFEIAAVPAPPEVLQSIAKGGRLLSLVIDAEEREEIRREGVALSAIPTPTPGEKDLKFLATQFGAGGAQPIDSSRVIIARTAHPNPKARRWVVAAITSSAEDPRVGVWSLTREEERKPDWKVLYSRTTKPKPGEDEAVLWAILNEVAEWQGRLVAPFGPL